VARRSATRPCSFAIIRPRIAILDELDSGLDVDALGQVSRRIERATREGDSSLGVIAITHYRRLLAEFAAQRVHVLSEGRIAASGGPELAAELEATDTWPTGRRPLGPLGGTRRSRPK